MRGKDDYCLAGLNIDGETAYQSLSSEASMLQVVCLH